MFVERAGSVLVNNQLDAQFFFSYIFIPILYMFRAPLCSSSGESIVLMRHLVYVSYVGDRQVCRFGWSSIQTSPDDENSGARNI
jgi:hypothetical protein